MSYIEERSHFIVNEAVVKAESRRKNRGDKALKEMFENSVWRKAYDLMEVAPKAIRDEDLYEVLLSPYAPPQPERLRPIVEASYRALTERYRKSISEFPDVPLSLVGIAYRLYNSIENTVVSLPEPEGLSFRDLVETHDMLIKYVAGFTDLGKIYSNGVNKDE